MPIPARLFQLGMLLAATFAPSVSAATEARTRLIDCDAGTCLLVAGHRADPASDVTINGHAVAVQGARKWHVKLPIETVRGWSAAYARTITVSVVDAQTRQSASSQVGLPIGLFYHRENLAMLVVSVK